MINENTLDLLQDIAFGADIDSLESYIADFRYASKATDVERYRYNYDRMVQLLKEVKPDSTLLNSEESSEELPFDQYDRYFEQYGNIRKCTAYNVLDNLVTSDVRDKIAKSRDSVSDILALVSVQGLDVMCTYKNGYLCKVYLIGESKKISDITYYVEDKLPSRIKEFTKYGLVELRGKLTIHKDSELSNTSKHIETAVAHSIRCKVHTEELSIVFSDLLCNELNISTQWEKMEFMQSLDIDVATYVLVRGIDCDILHQAMSDIDKAFVDIQSELDWFTYGFEVRLNDYTDNTTGFICILDDADYRKSYDAIVKSIYTDSFTNKQVLKVVATQCNKRFVVDTIDIQDIYDIEKYGIAIGEKVQFRVIEKQPIIG